MSIADQIPTFNDEQLASLRANAVRLEATSEGNKRQTAADLIPLIDAELAVREAAKPPKKPKAAPKPRAKKTAAETA